ncbi:hypothetical protein JTE90_015272 [Oedothorax gibbosus]|uniref:EGF-like domain-containing protein n=1 Tax=Oedothorax gibbosus TaxID=931172 RepID=A0AAV6UBA5_9ARAC|nr:hypothetical protein JTE90_015272 [Oedothorax gibbosus]
MPFFVFLEQITCDKTCNRLLQCLFFLAFPLLFVEGNVEVCYNVQPPDRANNIHNCSLVCTLKFEYVVSGVHNEELALCMKNTSKAVNCEKHVDCRKHHTGAFCKTIPCLCKADQSSEESYIIRSSVRMPKINTCVVPARHVNPDMPIVPFPWRTLLYVAAIVFLFASCLVCLRWLSPLIRSMQLKRATRENPDRQTAGDSASLFCSASGNSESASTPFTYYFPRGMPRIYRASPRGSHGSSRASTRARYVTCAMAEGTVTLSGQDKPPPYETAIQLPPPAYEDVERAVIESGNNFSQRVEVHAAPSMSTNTQPVNPIS